MAYDSARHVTVLFGGQHVVNSQSNAETWEWNGTAWTQRAVTGPSARFYHSMVFDSTRGVTVLFGGATSANLEHVNGETWEWDGTVWTQRFVSGPSSRVLLAMAFNDVRHVTVLHGGYVGNAVYSNETWEWNGVVWNQRVVANPPPTQSHGSMSFDSGRNVCVLTGGANGTQNHDTWEWNGVVWTQFADGPFPRGLQSSVFLPGCGETILFGGTRAAIALDGLCDQVWGWNGSAWTQHALQSRPSPRMSMAMAYDSDRKVAVMFGGATGLQAISNQTWELSTCEPPCYANCDGSTVAPFLTANDFQCFLNKFSAGCIP